MALQTEKRTLVCLGQSGELYNVTGTLEFNRHLFVNYITATTVGWTNHDKPLADFNVKDDYNTFDWAQLEQQSLQFWSPYVNFRLKSIDLRS